MQNNDHLNSDTETEGVTQGVKFVRTLKEWKLELGLFIASITLLSQVIFIPGSHMG